MFNIVHGKPHPRERRTICRRAGMLGCATICALAIVSSVSQTPAGALTVRPVPPIRTLAPCQVVSDNANYSGCNFGFDDPLTGFTMTDDNFTGDTFSSVNASGANFTGSDFNGANLYNGDFSGANLTSAQLGGC